MAAEHDIQTVKRSGKSINGSSLDADIGKVAPIIGSIPVGATATQVAASTAELPVLQNTRGFICQTQSIAKLVAAVF